MRYKGLVLDPGDGLEFGDLFVVNVMRHRSFSAFMVFLLLIHLLSASISAPTRE